MDLQTFFSFFKIEKYCMFCDHYIVGYYTFPTIKLSFARLSTSLKLPFKNMAKPSRLHLTFTIITSSLRFPVFFSSYPCPYYLMIQRVKNWFPLEDYSMVPILKVLFQITCFDLFQIIAVSNGKAVGQQPFRSPTMLRNCREPTKSVAYVIITFL